MATEPAAHICNESRHRNLHEMPITPVLKECLPLTILRQNEGQFCYVRPGKLATAKSASSRGKPTLYEANSAGARGEADLVRGQLHGYKTKR